MDRFYEYARENLEELKIWKDDQDGIHVSFAIKRSKSGFRKTGSRYNRRSFGSDMTI